MRKLVLFTLILTLSFQCVVSIDAHEQTGSDSVYARTDIPPVFPGGEQGLFQYIGENMVYPKEALEQQIQGKAYCQFIIEKDGTISDIHIVRSSQNTQLDEEALRLLRDMPAWTPGRINDKPVRTRYVLPIIFRIKEEPKTTTVANETDSLTTNVDIMPEFEGGQEALFAFLSNEISYPPEAIGIEGRAVCSFVIDVDGTVTEVTLAQSSGNRDLDKEALRVVHAMPNWKPGIKNGEPVQVKYTIPVNFTFGDVMNINYKETNAQKVLQKYLDEHFEYEPFKSGFNDVYLLNISIPLSVTIDSTGMILQIVPKGKIKSNYKYVKGRETYEEKDGRKVKTISNVTFEDNKDIINHVQQYCNELEEALHQFVNAMSQANIRCNPSMKNNKPCKATIAVTLYRDGLKKYHIKRVDK